MTSISQDDQQLDQRNISAIDRILESPSRWDQLMAKWSDRISPILVRETRQQLKSRQFVITFWAVLVFILIWTIYGIAENMPAIYYESTGPFMMAGYFVLFLLPTCISVPLAAYQSMAAEMDEGTGDVLAISTLTPWQIVAGKLLAAMLQTFLYLATLTPCIVLTYLLRGLSIETIFVILFTTIILSAATSAVGIFLASTNRQGQRPVVSMLGLMLICIPLTLTWMGWGMASLNGARSFFAGSESSGFWLAMLPAWGLGLAYMFLALNTAAAQIGILAENYAKPIRFWLLATQWVWLSLGIAITLISQSLQGEVWAPILIVLACQWLVAGSLMLREPQFLSLRARRSLARSPLQRIVSAWLNPGGSWGYIFVVVSFSSALLVVEAHRRLSFFAIRADANFDWTMIAAVVMACHLVFYLGAARLLLLRLQQRHSRVSGFLIVILLLALGSVLPILISLALNGFNNYYFEPYSIFNPMWAVLEAFQENSVVLSSLPLLVLAAAVVFLAVLRNAAKTLHALPATPALVPASKSPPIDPLKDD
jgi:hypothetical protein